MKLFTVGKIPMYCEGIAHRIERRKSGDAKVVDLALKIEPFSAQLAAALDQGEYGFVKRMLFKLQDGSPIRDVRAVDFKPPADRQKLICFAAPDTVKASIALDHVKVTKMRARSQKSGDAWVLYLYASYGPLGKTELEYVNAWYTEQRFITVEAAEPSLEFADETEAEENGEGEESAATRPAPMFDDPRDVPPAAASANDPARRLPRRHAAKQPH